MGNLGTPLSSLFDFDILNKLLHDGSYFFEVFLTIIKMKIKITEGKQQFI